MLGFAALIANLQNGPTVASCSRDVGALLAGTSGCSRRFVVWLLVEPLPRYLRSEEDEQKVACEPRLRQEVLAYNQFALCIAGAISPTVVMHYFCKQAYSACCHFSHGPGNATT